MRMALLTHWFCAIMIIALLQPQGFLTLAQSTTTNSTITQIDTLGSLLVYLYAIPVEPGSLDPEIAISVVKVNGSGSAHLFCNPDWTQQGANGTFPQPDHAIWKSEGSSGENSVIISPTDPLYRPPNARNINDTAYAKFTPSFTCSVINVDAVEAVTYSFSKLSYQPAEALIDVEAKAIASIYNRCCGGEDSASDGICRDWKQKNLEVGGVFTNMCKFTGQLCTTTGSLRRLDLTAFGLECPFPAEELAQFLSLESLILPQNPGLTGKLSSVFSSLAAFLPSLKILDLSEDSGLSGPIRDSSGPEGICSLAKTLTTLAVPSVGVTGDLPACLFSEPSKILTLSAENNNLTGKIPDVFTTASRLAKLNVSSNQLTGTLPVSLLNLRNVSSFDVSRNRLSGAIPDVWWDMRPLTYLGFQFNSFIGGIPPSILVLPNLVKLDVTSNRLSMLPERWLSPFTNMTTSLFKTLRLASNQFQGTFPQALATAPYLETLHIHNNSFSGSLPNVPGMFPSLRVLNISGNAFSGPIPPWFNTSGIFRKAPARNPDGTIFNHVFDISNNHLTGAVPSFLSKTCVPFYALQGILLGGNDLIFNCSSSFTYIQDICGPSALNTSSV